MRKLDKTVFAAFALAVLIGSGAAQAAFTTPWDAMTGDSWILSDPTAPLASLPRIYPANSSTVYRLGFGNASGGAGEPQKARGLNSTRFLDGPGHYETNAQSGDFTVGVVNAGKNPGSENYGAVLVLIAIDASSLGADFACSINGSALDRANDFAYYDPTSLGYGTGRPSGYYSATNPTGETLTHIFDKGMVTVFAIEDLVDAQGVGLASGSSKTFTYAFENLPGKAVFSVYGANVLDGGEMEEIYHTNRGTVDVNNASKGVSTFTVVPEPTSITLLACLTVALVGKRKRRRGKVA